MLPNRHCPRCTGLLSRRTLVASAGAGLIGSAAARALVPGAAGAAGAGLTPAVVHAGAVDDIPIGASSVDYVDPEFNPAAGRVTFRDTWEADGSVWVGALDAATGALATETGRDIFVDRPVPTVDEQTDNGPEWIRDDGVDKVLYTRTDGGRERIYMRDLTGGPPEPLGPDDGVSRTHCAGTRAVSGSAKILYRRWVPALVAWRLVWLDAANPTREVLLPDAEARISLPTWIDTRSILISQLIGGVYQLAVYDTVSPSVLVLTADADDKVGAYAWRAPELGGRLLYVAAVRPAGQSDVTAVRVYWRERASDQMLTPYATLGLPADAPVGGVRSPEPFTFQGRSYVCLAIEPGNTLDTAVCVLSVPPVKDGPPWRPPQRVDDAFLRAHKIDPEPYATDARVFVYYYYRDPTTRRTRLRRCAVTPVA